MRCATGALHSFIFILFASTLFGICRAEAVPLEPECQTSKRCELQLEPLIGKPHSSCLTSLPSTTLITCKESFGADATVVSAAVNQFPQLLPLHKIAVHGAIIDLGLNLEAYSLDGPKKANTFEHQ